MKWYFWLSGFFFIIGLLYSAFNNELLVVQLPFNKAIDQQETTTKIKKKIVLHYWQHEAWHSENGEILWSENKAHNLTSLINNWLAMLDEEGVTTKKISLQLALLAASGTEAFISFDSYPFFKEASTYDKLQWIEGLLKTVRTNNLQLQTIRFLVHHQELLDAHLDFSCSWPIVGFLNQ